MKKTLALILAAMMVAGTASVAFAVEPSDVRMGDDLYVWDSDDSRYELLTEDTVNYGDKIGFELTDEAKTAVITDSDEVKNLKAYPEYKVGEGLVAGKPTIEYRKVYVDAHKEYTGKAVTTVKTFEIDVDSDQTPDTLNLPASFNLTSDNKYDIADLTEKLKAANTSLKDHIDEALASKIVNDSKAGYSKEQKDVAGSTEYRYMIVMELKESTTTASKDLFGEMYVGRTSNGAKDERALPFNLTVSNDKENSGETDYFKVEGKENWVIDFDDSDVCDIEFMSENSNTSYALFTVDASGQGKENVGFSVKYNSEIAAKYPEANLEFIKFTATPTFNRTGELWIYADEDSYIYEVTADGLKEIKNAEYDESAEAWYIKTRTLKSYVTSDVELDVTASSSSSEDASSSGTSSSNPTTGGTTGTTGGNPGDKYNPNTGR
ncbi:hypothetical protein [Merdimmobilis hominis]|uniref:hypothetical protein n=1 Tax=Merdimmobilis hominis TaxID=2897707 RepID=UPI0032D43A2E